MIKYVTGGYTKNLIGPIEVERETKSSVWINNRRAPKRSSYINYFDTWDEAKAFLMDRAEANVKYARAHLDNANSKLGNIKGLKKTNDHIHPRGY